jgi:gliding motility-associated-like protein
MKYVFLLLCFCLSNVLSYAQGENNIWAFGKGFGLDFNSETPYVAGMALNTIEGSASICDKNGRLRFYSDGFKAFNRNHKMMPNGDGLLTSGSVTQGVSILPFPDDTSKYYLFVIYVDEIKRAYALHYSVVDMKLNGGLGDIVPTQKNITIDDSLSEKMLVTRASGCAYWVIVHSGYSPEFHAFKISNTGIDINPVISTTSFVGEGIYGIGEMKMAPNNQKIVLTNWRSKGWLGSVELFDFDSTVGTMSNYRLIDSSKSFAAYGIEFSPDNRKLYVAYSEDDPRPPYPLVQYNLDLLPDIALIRSTKTTIKNSYNWGGMRIFRDKVYVIQCGGLYTNISVINNPNKVGLACNFQDSLFIIDSPAFGLGNRVPESLPNIYRRTDTAVCQSIIYSGAADYYTYLWSDGSQEFSRTIVPPATLWLTSMKGSCAPAITDTFVVKSKTFEVNLGVDKLLCGTQSTELLAPADGAQYLWSDGSTSQSIKANKTDFYWLTIKKEDCIASDTIFVRVGDCDKCIAVPNAFSPNKDGRNDAFHALSSCNVLQYNMKIFNRYGQEVFGADNISQSWDGTFNGMDLNAGVYFYLIKVRFDKPGATEELYKGDITLIR